MTQKMAGKKNLTKNSSPEALLKLEDLPNIGKSLATDLRQVNISRPQDFLYREPLEIFQALALVMGHRHDPCVFYTLLAVRHYLKNSEALPWWKFTIEGKRILTADRP